VDILLARRLVLAARLWQNPCRHIGWTGSSEVVMGSRLTEIVVDCHDPDAQAAFWAAALGYHVVRREDGQVEIAPWQREPPGLAEQVRQAPAVPTLVFVAVPEAKTVKNRLHLDLRPVGLAHAAEVERLIGLGAHRADIGQGEVPWVVLADPEGNEFCVLGPLGGQP
jgi:catechol 2,3-dioxygenase-like lactoylglutathione lyase family enzyme